MDFYRKIIFYVAHSQLNPASHIGTPTYGTYDSTQFCDYYRFPLFALWNRVNSNRP